jgi:hypothetical protein
MRWFRIRSASVDSRYRKTFEQYGAVGMQILLGIPNSRIRLDEGKDIRTDNDLPGILSWLTEQYDRAERKETWLITMEVAITVFVGVELLIEGWRLYFHC